MRMLMSAQSTSGDAMDIYRGESGATLYLCPAHPWARQESPGRCPECNIDFVAEGTRFALLRHAFGDPLHLVVMGAAMVAAMIVVMMI